MQQIGGIYMSVIMENETRPDEALDRRDAVAGKLHRRRKQLASVYSGIETKSLPEPVIYTDDAYATKQIERARNEEKDKAIKNNMELIL